MIDESLRTTRFFFLLYTDTNLKYKKNILKIFLSKQIIKFTKTFKTELERHMPLIDKRKVIN